MTWPAFISLLLQVSPVPSPAPPPLPAPGSDAFARERDAYAERLRRACLSEAGVRIAVEGWSRSRQAAPARAAESRRADREVAEAALTPPVDLSRLERALSAKRAADSRFFEDVDRQSLAVLRQLSPEDRAIYAQRVTTAKPAIPPRRCERRGP